MIYFVKRTFLLIVRKS